MAKPILVLQMQRMGDLILSFPLFLWLRKTYPDRRIRVVAEESFYKGLIGLSPEVLYIPWQNHGQVLKKRYSLVINLSHRPEAAWLAGRVKAEERIGPFEMEDDSLRIQGKWQLYRAGIVHNNRYNRFHWAELNGLDAVDPQMIRMTKWSAPPLRKENRRVGVFIGASQAIKRPDTDFFVLLCKELIRKRYQPVILGGPAEKKLAKQVVSQCGIKPLNMVGRLSLPRLASIFSSLGLLITPDTGPMHLAAWTGLPILNLSLGPVNPWETGPYQPGHTIVRSSVSCTGCWECIRDKPLCVNTFKVRQVVLLAQKTMSRDWQDLKHQGLKGINVYVSGRRQGLYHLDPRKSKSSAADCLGVFWQSFWSHRFGLASEKQVMKNAAQMAEHYPFLTDKFRKSSVKFLSQLKAIIQKGRIPDSGFWKQSPPYFRPLVGYSHLYWQNHDYSSSSLSASISMIQDLLDMLQS